MGCEWPTGNALMLQYHDEEWGVPVHDDRLLFEHLALDGFQAGLSWQTILNKRENFRRAFENFNIARVAEYDTSKIELLMQDAGIIRNRQKIEATINNARRVLEVQEEFGTFDRYIWQFTGGKTKVNRCRTLQDIPATSGESDAMSKELKKRGFKFCGSTICYAFMQATGMVNDHVVDCYRYEEVMR